MRMQLDPTADLVGEEVYNDGMAPDDEELALLSQFPVHKDLKVLHAVCSVRHSRAQIEDVFGE